MNCKHLQFSPRRAAVNLPTIAAPKVEVARATGGFAFARGFGAVVLEDPA
jgi:hypothetical protein